MTDIVERLRVRDAIYTPHWSQELMDEAADEIERLRAEIERLQDENIRLRVLAAHFTTLNQRDRQGILYADRTEAMLAEVRAGVHDQVAKLTRRLELRDDADWREAMELRERRERDMYDPEEQP